MTIVRSSGRPKYSTGSAAIRDVATNSPLRQRAIPGDVAAAELNLGEEVVGGVDLKRAFRTSGRCR